jgi:hypothetical protein
LIATLHPADSSGKQRKIFANAKAQELRAGA